MKYAIITESSRNVVEADEFYVDEIGTLFVRFESTLKLLCKSGHWCRVEEAEPEDVPGIPI